MKLTDKKKWDSFFKKYHIAVYSSETHDSLKNYHISKPLIIILIIIFVGILSTLSIILVEYTPLSRIFAKNETDIERIKSLEDKLRNISIEMLNLQEYSKHLRYALGDTAVKYKDISLSLSSTDFIEREMINHRNSSYSTENTILPDNSLNISFIVPVSNYVISQEFDEDRSHFGIDFAGKTNEPIFASADGFVIFSDWTSDYGNTIIIMHGSKFLTVYKHNASNIKNIGNYVRKGEVIAFLGNTGKLTTNPHLHFEIWKNGTAKNPLKYLLIKN